MPAYWRETLYKTFIRDKWEIWKHNNFHRESNSKTTLKFVHTSFHGVGHDYVQLAFQVFGFKPPIPVPEQKDPDPDFSTVKCPNPEEGESVLVYFFCI